VCLSCCVEKLRATVRRWRGGCITPFIARLTYVAQVNLQFGEQRKGEFKETANFDDGKQAQSYVFHATFTVAAFIFHGRVRSFLVRRAVPQIVTSQCLDTPFNRSLVSVQMLIHGIKHGCMLMRIR
jgi:hypothetical protein